MLNNITEEITEWSSYKVSYEKSYFDKTYKLLRQSITEKEKKFN